MVARVLAIAFNTYREAVRARILHGLLGLALCTSIYSLVLGTLSLHQETRVVADIGSASVSLFAVLVSIVMGATSLHRELELKTIFPILTRRLKRDEYVVGKFLGMWLTLAVFVALDGALVLALLGSLSGRSPALVLGSFSAVLAVGIGVAWRVPAWRTATPIALGAALLSLGIWLGAPAGAESRLVLASLALTLAEVAIICSVSLVFSAFSSPFLSAILTVWVFLIGRSADTLANLPARFLGPQVRAVGKALAWVFPNLHLYVPPRPLLLGLVDHEPVGAFVAHAWWVALGYVLVFLAAAAAIFRRRDFT